MALRYDDHGLQTEANATETTVADLHNSPSLRFEPHIHFVSLTDNFHTTLFNK